MTVPVLTPDEALALIPPAVCKCGAALHAVASPDLNDWHWLDDSGEMLVDRAPEGYHDDPKGWWARLADDDIALYSALTAREALGMLGWTHRHQPLPVGGFKGPVPYCCGMPMRLAPRGWVCRETKH